MPRLNDPNDERHGRLTPNQRMEFGELLDDTFNLASFDNMLANRLGIDREAIALGSNRKTIIYHVIDDAEMKWYTAELLQAARAERQRNEKLFAFSQQFGLEPSLVEPERMIREVLPEIDPAPWAQRLMERSSQVCRIDIPAAHARGTGFLVGPDLVLTNYHVVEVPIRLASRGLGRNVKVYLDRRVQSTREGIQGPLGLRSADWLVDYSPNSEAPFDEIPTTALDYALLRVAEGVRPGNDVVDTNTGAARGWVSIPLLPREFAKGDPLFVLGHPRGDSLKMTLDTDSVTETNTTKSRVRYTTNTDSGSSGSPCFDVDWELIALHHAGDRAEVAEFNEGIPIAAISEAWQHKIDGGELEGWQADILTRLMTQDFAGY